MGVVYLARDERLDRPVAIKLVTVTPARPESAARRPQKEARALARLNHPHLVTLLDYDELDDGTPAMVMEYVEGASLDRILPAHRFTAAEIALVLHQTADALATCHEQGVIHRDLKPGNLLVQVCDHPGLRVKVIDFGLTKLLADRGATALTLGGKVFGSPRFMAPEQWLRGDVDGRTDLYALGLVGYCMALGRHFIQATNPVDVFRSHLHDPRPPLTTTTDGRTLPPALAAILDRAAHPDPAARFPDARAMQAALEPLVRGVQVAFQLPGRPATGALPVVSAASVPLPDPSPIDDSAMQRAAESVEAPGPDADFDDDDRTFAAEPAPPDEFDPDRTCADVAAPEDLLATVMQAPTHDEPRRPPSLADAPLDDVSIPGPPEPVAERVRVGFLGSPHTAITRGDVERAVQASLEPAPAAPPVARPAPVARPVAAAPAAPAAARPVAAAPAAPAPRARDRWLLVAGGLLVAAVSAAATVFFLR